MEETCIESCHVSKGDVKKILKKYWVADMDARIILGGREFSAVTATATGDTAADFMPQWDGVCGLELDDAKHSAEAFGGQEGGVFGLLYGNGLNSFGVWYMSPDSRIATVTLIGNCNEVYRAANQLEGEWRFSDEIPEFILP